MQVLLPLGFSSLEKELPTLIREKRLSDVLDEPGDDDATETKLNSKEKVNKRHNFHAALEDERSMHSGNYLYSRQQENAKMENRNKTRNVQDKSYRGRNTQRSYGKRKLKSQFFSKTNKSRHRETTNNSQLNEKQQHKVILPGVRFGWLSQEVPRAPPPSEEMKHRMRMRMKRKKRRRLKNLKRVSEAKAETLHTEARNKTSGSSKTASEKQQESKTRATSPPFSSLHSPKTRKINSLMLSKQMKNSKKRKALPNYNSPSSLKRPKRISFNDDNAATDHFSSLEITLKSKILSRNPEVPSSSKSAASSSSKTPSSSVEAYQSPINEIPAVDILSNFFQHQAGSAGVKITEEDVTLSQNDIPNKGSRQRERKQLKMRQEKRDQNGDDEYELKLMEFQKKAIEEEEKRLREQFGPRRQKSEPNIKQSRLEKLNQENDEKEKEVQLLFEKFTQTDKQKANNKLKPSTIEQNAAKRSFGVTDSAINDFANSYGDDNVNGNDGGAISIGTKGFPKGQRRKMSKGKEIIKKQRTINVGGDLGDDDEITEVAFYDKQDDIMNQNKSVDGLIHSNKYNVSKERRTNEGNNFGTRNKTSLATNSNNDDSNTLVKNSISKTRDAQHRISSWEPDKLSDEEIDETKKQRVNGKKSIGSVEDQMENEDLMENKRKEIKDEVEVDIPKEHTGEARDNKYDRNKPIKSTGKKGSDKVDVDIDVVSDMPNPPIFTEIKEPEQHEVSNRITANDEKKVNKSLDSENKQQMTDHNDSDSNASDRSNSSGESSKNESSSKNDIIINNNSKSDSSKQKMTNKETKSDNVVLHDNRLMYILTGEEPKPSPKNTEPSNNAVKELTRDRAGKQWDHQTEILHDHIGLNNGKPLVRRQMIINKGLKSKIKEMHNRILNAHNRVSQELEQMEQELSTKFKTLQESMSMEKTLTGNIDSKINNSVLNVMKLATSSAKQAKTKLELVQSKYEISYTTDICLVMSYLTYTK